ncbi:Nicotinamide mononucleotide adenylyl transferase [Lasiodiplodia theobromae]|uniref:Nicotinamide-nucleotide adenylyltransferase n=1 Tax=Lasiodiplodia theobromae TaxID=45133 RepID=A0A5N5DSF3_9PEZI|nr:Nicotinamide mononucleotide adenylyl transferase [Lasiodiplodia theobromae]KAB2580968.1 Nicotinamide/nicotinic acid mononucleotide adenylyltransferase 1 [Lasiodiplodia theobromae]KAF4537021.1 Nicotinamide mononucleotide adenylyl transferase [Lasiodiplodia theobromae]
MSQQEPATQNGVSLATYEFPTQRLKKVLSDSSRTPLVLVACGSFSPITYLHLRIFEMALDWVRYNTEFEVVGGYLSPVGDAYKKAGLASAEHRINMCNLAVADSSWISVDQWEPLHKEYLPTAKVLDHFDHELNEVRGGIEDYTGQKRKVRVALLAGADLIQTMSTPNLWAPKDLDHILGHYGAFIVEREGTDIDDALASLQQWRDNIYVIHQLVKNDVSSTRIRLFLKRDMSIRYLVPEGVIKYIEANRLYSDEGEKKEDNGKVASASSSS